MTRADRFGRQPERRDDCAESLREWRLRAYMDHLEDLGYDLEGGGPTEDASAPPKVPVPTQAAAPPQAAAARAG